MDLFAPHEMDAALRTGDVEWFRAKFNEFGLPMSSPLVPEITMHKLRLDWKDCPPNLALESRLWLRSRNYSEGIR
jgi:hypothetical protein